MASGRTATCSTGTGGVGGSGATTRSASCSESVGVGGTGGGEIIPSPGGRSSGGRMTTGRVVGASGGIAVTAVTVGFRFAVRHSFRGGSSGRRAVIIRGSRSQYADRHCGQARDFRRARH